MTPSRDAMKTTKTDEMRRPMYSNSDLVRSHSRRRRLGSVVSMMSLYSRGMVVGVGGEKRWVLKGRNKVFIIVGN